MGDATTILLVEDEPLLRRAFRTLLEASGYRVSEAGSAAEALDRAAADAPDLVLLDLGLPDRNGLEIVNELRLRAGRPGMPVVAMTGRSGPDAARACEEAGCADHLIKPIAPLALVRRIPDWLAPPARGARAESPA